MLYSDLPGIYYGVCTKNQKQIFHNKMKSLNPVSSKKIGHYDNCKMDYPKNYNHKNNHNKISQTQIKSISQFNNSEYEQIRQLKLT
jgi:hypothetical protein